MKGNNQKVLIDSGYWIALYEPEKEPYRNEKANLVAELIEESIICIPWPTMYEFVNSRLGRRDTLFHFKKVIERSNTILIKDSIYKDSALDNLFYAHKKSLGDISLVDEIIKLMIVDKSLLFNYFVSFDEALCNYAVAHGLNINLQR